MGIRQTLNEKPALTAGMTAAIIVLALIFIFYQAFGGRPKAAAAASNKAFFTEDDGQTWFLDDASKIPPYDHNGKEAVRAQVYVCADGKPFCGHLERYPADQKAKMEDILKQNPTSIAALQYMGFGSMMEVKRPGDKKWIRSSPTTGADFGKIMQPVCPDGGTDGIKPVPPVEQ